jgi:hypothetical protein
MGFLDNTCNLATMRIPESGPVEAAGNILQMENI